MSERPHRKLVKCHVLFLGDSTPEHTNRGLQSLQQPLMKCYPVDSPSQVEGIDSWLTIFTSGILLQYVSNKNDQSLPIWFPIQNLYLAAATKCVNYIDGKTGRRMDTEFVDINSHAAEQSSHPPLFSITVRKTSGKRVLRCYTFLVRDEEPAVTMVDAAKYAFTHETGWSNSHPPDEVIRRELVSNAEDTDDVDQFDSVSAAGRKPSGNPASPGNQSQGDSDAPDQSRSRSFPAHLVKKYTLTNPNRGVGGTISPSSRRPIPNEFRHPGSLRSDHPGIRLGPPPIPAHMINGSGRIPATLPGSIRTTSSVRVVRDPRTRTPIIERVIRQEVPIPVPMPVYQPPPPPEIIHEVKPIYVPQPPEIRHVPVDREVPVPVEVPVPYPVPDHQGYEDEPYGRRSHRHKSHKSNTFKNYHVYDDQFARREGDRSSFFVNSGQPYNFAPPANGHFTSVGEHYRMSVPVRRGTRIRRDSSSSGESSDEDYKRRPAREYDPFSKRNGGIEITELSSPDERGKLDEQSGRKGRKKQSKDYHITQLETGTSGLNVREKNNNGVPGPEFKWSAIPSKSPTREREERKADRRRRSERKSREDSFSPVRGQGQVYVGADEVNGEKESKRSSYHVFRNATHHDKGQVYIGADVVDGEDSTRANYHAWRQNGDEVIEELKEKKKGKKKRDKTPSRVEDYPDYNGATTSKEYFFKEHTENPPRNWMDQKKEYMNERAFSSSLANDPDTDIPSAYALNREPEDDTMMDREMSGAPFTTVIPPAPALPSDWQTGGGNADSMY